MPSATASQTAPVQQFWQETENTSQYTQVSKDIVLERCISYYRAASLNTLVQHQVLNLLYIFIVTVYFWLLKMAFSPDPTGLCR